MFNKDLNIKNINKYTISFSILYIVAFCTIFIHYFSFNTTYHNKAISNFVQLSTLPGIVRSVSYNEPRFVEYKDYSTTLYTNLDNINTIGTTYE